MEEIVFAGSPSGPHLLITGGVHGDEFEPMQAIRSLAAFLDSTKLCGRVTLIPMVNEPAFARGQRTGEDGLDLARTCPGNPQGSVTEQIAAELSARIRQTDFYIDLHTGGTRFTISPLAGYMLHSDPAVLGAQRRMAHAFNLPIIWGTSAELNGRSLSVARDAGVPAIYCEHGGGGGCRPEGVQDYVDGCLNVMGSLGMISRDLPISRVKHVVEDSRPQSGHLQINYNASCAGYFQPAVRLDQTVQSGDLLGQILTACGDVAEEIRAKQSGLILLLATFPSVQAGDCTCVILETSVGAPGFPADLFSKRI
ncbi:MAG: M14 family metallopeptidase [Planctomycetales bacterium]